MKVSIILGHPTPGSFNHAIVATAEAALRASGHDVRITISIARIRSGPAVGRDPEGRVLPPEIEAHCQEIGEADGIIIVHPNYWSAPPAILRGWVDRVLRPGRAYNFVPDGQGGAKPVGLLKARSGLVFTTANTPHEKEVAAVRRPARDALAQGGVRPLRRARRPERWDFSPVIVSTPEQREAWLNEVCAAVAQYFPRRSWQAWDLTGLAPGWRTTMGAKRVLLVDDDVDFLEINRMTLEKAGFEVVTADNGDQGFRVATVDARRRRRARRHDGYADRRVRAGAQAAPGRADEALPLLMLTSVNTENEAIGSFVRFSDRDRDKDWLPVDRFVDKPIKPEDLVSLVRTLAGAWTFTHK